MEEFDIKAQTKSEAGEYNYLLRDGVDKFLYDFCAENKPLNILEIGTAFGYSAYILLSSCNSKLTTIEIDKEKSSLARQNLQKENLLERCNLLCGDAKNILPNLNEKYDLIFLDGPKGQYIKYLPKLLSLLNINGTLIADNIYFQGMVLQEGFVAHKHRTIVVNLRKFIDEISNNSDLQTTLYQIGDGISVSKKLK